MFRDSIRTENEALKARVRELEAENERIRTQHDMDQSRVILYPWYVQGLVLVGAFAIVGILALVLSLSLVTV